MDLVHFLLTWKALWTLNFFGVVLCRETAFEGMLMVDGMRFRSGVSLDRGSAMAGFLSLTLRNHPANQPSK